MQKRNTSLRECSVFEKRSSVSKSCYLVSFGQSGRSVSFLMDSWHVYLLRNCETKKKESNSRQSSAAGGGMGSDGRISARRLVKPSFLTAQLASVLVFLASSRRRWLPSYFFRSLRYKITFWLLSITTNGENSVVSSLQHEPLDLQSSVSMFLFP